MWINQPRAADTLTQTGAEQGPVLVSLLMARSHYLMQMLNIIYRARIILEKYLGDTVTCFKWLYLAIIPIFWVLPSSIPHLHLEGSGVEVLHFAFLCQHFQFQLGWKNPQWSQGRALQKSADPIQGGTEHWRGREQIPHPLGEPWALPACSWALLGWAGLESGAAPAQGKQTQLQEIITS